MNNLLPFFFSLLLDYHICVTNCSYLKYKCKEKKLALSVIFLTKYLHYRLPITVLYYRFFCGNFEISDKAFKVTIKNGKNKARRKNVY